ncbi:hypothetical protein CROQUDRAFT_436984 [Cronartium quercuum f. sp. fusiforme G11]|uniref:Uncharacterized protein n=1 Tax=Cronartium quercuum f. sp. fusiforme G11 TaxID=708437 RepID=A0A9P6N6C5_9BASI|nr:hypothetical protein CROQUDRAFT_436984 [Cronartium quercuum f. sp. fusiforme G11]
MPLPIETPAPKASSLIKKFQQTIDASDEPSVPLLPKLRLSVGADDPAYRRRSWAVGSGGASIPQTGVIWKGSHLKSGTESNQPLEVTKTNNETSATPRLMTIPPTPIDNSTSKSPETPIFQPETPIEKSTDTFNRMKPSVEPQIDKLSHVKAKVIKSAVSSISSDRPKASVSADVPTVRTRKVTNITAPTAASLAKIRSSDSPIPDTRHQSNLLPKVKPDPIINHHHSKLLPKKSNLQQIRLPSSPPLQTNQRIRAASAAPKSRDQV